MNMTRREFQQLLGKALVGSMAGAVGGALAGTALPAWSGELDSTADLLRHIHPELRPLAERFAAMASATPPLAAATLAKRREGMGQWARPLRADIPWEERRVPRADGGDVRVYVVNAKPGLARPAILHTHGGGFVLGEAKGEIWRLQDLAATLDCVIVTVEYRLAPETRHEGSVEDNYAGLKWLHDNATALGVDRQRIALLGESAGGGHAALLAITARDRGEVPVRFQCLVYPMLDDRTGSSRPVPAHIGKLVWTAADNRFGWQAFLGVAAGSPAVPARGVPARVEQVAGLPPAFIGVGALDLFVDEDIVYAQRLIDTGVATELLVVPGAFHGFDLIGEATSVGRGFTEAKLAALRRAFATPG